jgi:hypothetical protein
MSALAFFAWTALETSVNDPAGINRAASAIAKTTDFAGAKSAF